MPRKAFQRPHYQAQLAHDEAKRRVQAEREERKAEVEVERLRIDDHEERLQVIEGP